MKLRAHQRISLELAQERALAALTHEPAPASCVADHIWPEHEMKGQGAGAAASRILKTLEKRGLAKWAHTGRSWGWVRCRA